jgi:D-glycero-D-manno-heptose 1,7-bisphosphate phosphatase
VRKAEHPIDAAGLWCEVLSRPAVGGPALFLDRDGVVVEDTEYLCRVEDVAIIPGAARIIAAANGRNIPVVLITNQGGIGCGYYGWDDFVAVQDTIIAALAAEGAHFDAVYACPHHPNGRGELAHPDHPARKPNPGIVLRAAADLSLDLAKSWLVGDKASDVEAARRAGLAGALQVLTGHGKNERSKVAEIKAPNFDLRLGQSIADALALPIFAQPPR